MICTYSLPNLLPGLLLIIFSGKYYIYLHIYFDSLSIINNPGMWTALPFPICSSKDTVVSRLLVCCFFFLLSEKENPIYKHVKLSWCCIKLLSNFTCKQTTVQQLLTTFTGWVLQFLLLFMLQQGNVTPGYHILMLQKLI